MTAKPDWPAYLKGNITRWVQGIGVEGPTTVSNEILLTCIDAIRDEREACAALIDEMGRNHPTDQYYGVYADAIRARGTP